MKIDLDTKLSTNKIKILSYAGIFYGLIFTIVGIFSEQDESALYLSTIGILLCAAGVSSFVIQKKNQKSRLSSKFNSIFFELIKEKNGKITVLDFSIKANLEPKEAREFIEQKSIQLGAITEIDDEARIIYIFK